jgi:ABC-type lipoprotein release transport system permease subunit
MGQQQLLLIILGVIVVGIAVAVGITMFADSAISANRDALTNDLVNLAARAQQFYRRPISLGGGGNDWTKLTTITQLTNRASNANGTYALVGAGSGTGVTGGVEIRGIGTELNGAGVLVEVHVKAFSDRDSAWIVQ